MTNVNALLALGSARKDSPNPLMLGSVTSAVARSATVLLDGAETPSTVVTPGPTAYSVGNRVIVTRIGRTLYALVNLTTG